jgi:hypothetical protein
MEFDFEYDQNLEYYIINLNLSINMEHFDYKSIYWYHLIFKDN